MSASRLLRLIRAIMPSHDQQWLDAALAETPYLAPGDSINWRAGIVTLILRWVARRLATGLVLLSGLLAAAALVGWLDLQIEPTSVSLVLILVTGAICGYMTNGSWPIAGVVIGSSISLSALAIRAMNLSVAGDHPPQTSMAAILALLVLVVPTLLASWLGATVRRRRPNKHGGADDQHHLEDL